MGNNREKWRTMGGHTSEYHFQFFPMHIDKVTQNRIPVQNSWCWDNFSASQRDFRVSWYHNKRRTIGGLREFWRSYTPVFSLKGVFGRFRKSQQNSALSDLFSGNGGWKGPPGGGFHPPPGKVGLRQFKGDLKFSHLNQNSHYIGFC